MKYPHQEWRLLITPPANGAWNMAVDEALLEAVGKNRSLAFLRLYAWEPACLSIGYAQSFRDIDHHRRLELGWDWVRRPTGGRAILHIDELTYSVVASLQEPRVAGSVLESYQRLSAALIESLHLLNIPAAPHPINTSATALKSEPVCFEVPSNYEIVIGDKKLVGSAQARRKEGVLQHGTLPLWGDLTRITQALRYKEERERKEAGERLLAHATTVENVLGLRIDWSAAVEAFIAGFQSTFNLDFIRYDLSDEEAERANQLVTEKYTHPSWMERI
jgi:lipoyl(octanoyl) transferase